MTEYRRGESGCQSWGAATLSRTRAVDASPGSTVTGADVAATSVPSGPTTDHAIRVVDVWREAFSTVVATEITARSSSMSGVVMRVPSSAMCVGSATSRCTGR